MRYRRIHTLDNAFAVVTSRWISGAARSEQAVTRMPKPVRDLLTSPGTEVEWNPKTREARLVPYWERHHI